MARYQVEQARCRAQAADLAFRVVLPTDLPGVRADGKRLEQAVANLVDNACKYAPSGSEICVAGTHLTAKMPRPESLPVAFGASLGRGEWVGLSITNRSAPIPATDLPRIFERFYRGDAARQRSEGSGLGLAIVRETILAHGGRVEAASDESGTRFRVWLPVV